MESNGGTEELEIGSNCGNRFDQFDVTKISKHSLIRKYLEGTSLLAVASSLAEEVERIGKQTGSSSGDHKTGSFSDGSISYFAIS
jgi:hypothetical protein